MARNRCLDRGRAGALAGWRIALVRAYIDVAATNPEWHRLHDRAERYLDRLLAAQNPGLARFSLGTVAD